MPGEVAFQVGREVAFHAGMTRGEVAFEEVASRGMTRGGVCGAVASRGAVAGGCASCEPSKSGVASGTDAERAARARLSAAEEAVPREGRLARSCSTVESDLRLVRFCIRFWICTADPEPDFCNFSRACEMIVPAREPAPPTPAAVPAGWGLLERAGEAVLPSQSVDSSRLARRARASLSFRCVLASPWASANAVAAPASAGCMDR